MSQIESAEQLIVLGRGMDGAGPSDLTRQRAKAARLYYDEFEPGLVVFSGGTSHLADGQRGFSEAGAMAEIAGLPGDVTGIESKSTSTAENFINSAEFLDLTQSIGVLAHNPHLPRALFLAHKILGVNAFGISAEELGASPESLKTRITERANRIASYVTYAGVRPGDLEQFRGRDERLHRVKRAVRSVVSRQPQYQ